MATGQLSGDGGRHATSGPFATRLQNTLAAGCGLAVGARRPSVARGPPPLGQREPSPGQRRPQRLPARVLKTTASGFGLVGFDV